MRIIGAMLFIDGALRAVYLDHGREFYLRADGQPVYGDWSHLEGPEILVHDAQTLPQSHLPRQSYRQSDGIVVCSDVSQSDRMLAQYASS